MTGRVRGEDMHGLVTGMYAALCLRNAYLPDWLFKLTCAHAHAVCYFLRIPHSGVYISVDHDQEHWADTLQV
eukprot:363737-Chlamydomonas_euryale.AAC.14